MVHIFRVLIAVVATVLASAVAAAAPAAADESEYLRLLQPKYVFLSSQQLLNEGHKVCDAIHRGMISPDAANMVQKDLAVSLATAVDIVGAAGVQLGWLGAARPPGCLHVSGRCASGAVRVSGGGMI